MNTLLDPTKYAHVVVEENVRYFFINAHGMLFSVLELGST